MSAFKLFIQLPAFQFALVIAGAAIYVIGGHMALRMNNRRMGRPRRIVSNPLRAIATFNAREWAVFLLSIAGAFACSGAAMAIK